MQYYIQEYTHLFKKEQFKRISKSEKKHCKLTFLQKILFLESLLEC